MHRLRGVALAAYERESVADGSVVVDALYEAGFADFDDIEGTIGGTECSQRDGLAEDGSMSLCVDRLGGADEFRHVEKCLNGECFWRRCRTWGGREFRCEAVAGGMTHSVARRGEVGCSTSRFDTYMLNAQLFTYLK